MFRQKPSKAKPPRPVSMPPERPKGSPGMTRAKPGRPPPMTTESIPEKVTSGNGRRSYLCGYKGHMCLC